MSPMRDLPRRALAWYRETVPRPVRFGITYVALLTVVIGALTSGLSHATQPSDSGAMADACQEEFGDEWGHGGYIAGNPPTLTCQHPNGTQGMMDMPEHIQREKGIVSTRAASS